MRSKYSPWPPMPTGPGTGCSGSRRLRTVDSWGQNQSHASRHPRMCSLAPHRRAARAGVQGHRGSHASHALVRAAMTTVRDAQPRDFDAIVRLNTESEHFMNRMDRARLDLLASQAVYLRV